MVDRYVLLMITDGLTPEPVVIYSVVNVVHVSKVLSDRLDPRSPEHFVLDLFTRVTDTWEARNSLCQQRGGQNRGVETQLAYYPETAGTHVPSLQPSLGLPSSEHNTSFNDF